MIFFVLACSHPAAFPPQVQTGGPETPTIAPLPAGISADAMTDPPFGVEALKSAFPVGTVVRLRMRKAGEAETVERWQVTAADDSGMTIASTVYNADGSLLRDEGSGTSTWVELTTHGQFPVAKTVREDSSVDVPAGHFDTWLYTVVDSEKDTVSRYHFAKTLPGPPVLFTVVAGKGTVFEMALLERK